MKQIRIIVCIVSLIIIALTSPSLAQVGGQNTTTDIASYQIKNTVDPIYFLMGQAIFAQNNEMIKTIIETLTNSLEGQMYLSDILRSSYLYENEEFPPLLTISMLVSNAEAFDLIYKNILGEDKIFALQDAFQKFPKEEGKVRDNRFAIAIQEIDVFNFMFYYTEAEANGTIIEDLKNAFMEFEGEDVIIEPQRK